MNLSTLTLSTLGVLGAVGVATLPGPGEVGSPLPDIDLADFAQTEAASLDDYFGQVVLLEWFAHW